MKYATATSRVKVVHCNAIATVSIRDYVNATHGMDCIHIHDTNYHKWYITYSPQ